MTNEQIKEFTRRTTQENHSGLILVLCDMEQVFIDDAIRLYSTDIDGYMKSIDKARRTLNELISCFVPSDKQGRDVISVLRYVYGRLVASSVKRSPQDLELAKGMFGQLRVAFEELHRLDTDGPVMKNTHQVYAGLTYGRGTLNESTLGVDYSNRGFKI